jgi:hypothetical protein
MYLAMIFLHRRLRRLLESEPNLGPISSARLPGGDDLRQEPQSAHSSFIHSNTVQVSPIATIMVVTNPRIKHDEWAPLSHATANEWAQAIVASP